MKISLNELKEMDSFTLEIKGVEVVVKINNDDLDVNINFSNEFINRETNEKTKQWFDKVMNKADEYAEKKRLKKNKLISDETTKCKNGDVAVIDILDRMKDDDNLKTYIKSLSMYGEKTDKERSEIMFGINPVLNTDKNDIEKE